MALSAVRSFLFNEILAERVDCQCWDRLLAGDVANLAGSGSCFAVAEVDRRLTDRIAAHDIHPTGLLAGRGSWLSHGAALDLERRVVDRYGELFQGLQAAGLQASRRACRLTVQDLHWDWLKRDQLALDFRLQRGGFATSVLRELVEDLQDGRSRSTPQ